MFDAHTHVQFAAFEKDWKQIIDRALKSGVSLVNIGTQRDTSSRAIEIAHLYKEGVYATVGLHPIHTAKSFHDQQELGPPPPEAAAGQGGGFIPKGFTSRGEKFDYKYYLKLARDPKVVAIGECGLDYYRSQNDELRMKNDEWKQKQKDVFLEHIKIAQEVGKPLMVHCRPARQASPPGVAGGPSKGTDDAYEDLIRILSDAKGQLSAVLHFFVGSPATVKRFLEFSADKKMPLYFTFGGVITFARDYDEQINMIPLNRILTETDAPYVAPEPYRGKRNEPAYVIEVVRKLAQLKNVSFEEMARITAENAQRVFSL